MNRHEAESLAKFTSLTEKLPLRRYRLAIVCGQISSGKSRIAQQISSRSKARYIGLTTDLLPQTTMIGFSPTLGAYGPDDLASWILHQAINDDPFVIVDQIEPLLATFGRTQVVRFFQMIGQAEPRNPVILVTYLEKEVKESAFPEERLLHL